MRKMPHGAPGSWMHLFLRVWSAKTRRPHFEPLCLTTPLHGAVYQVWDLPHTSVVLPHKWDIFLWYNAVSSHHDHSSSFSLASSHSLQHLWLRTWWSSTSVKNWKDNAVIWLLLFFQLQLNHSNITETASLAFSVWKVTVQKQKLPTSGTMYCTAVYTLSTYYYISSFSYHGRVVLWSNELDLTIMLKIAQKVVPWSDLYTKTHPSDTVSYHPFVHVTQENMNGLGLYHMRLEAECDTNPNH